MDTKFRFRTLLPSDGPFLHTLWSDPEIVGSTDNRQIHGDFSVTESALKLMMEADSDPKAGAFFRITENTVGEAFAWSEVLNIQGRWSLRVLVSKQSQGRGIGSWTLVQVEALAKSEGCREISVGIRDYAKGVQRWFEKRGYRPTERRRGDVGYWMKAL